MRAGTHLAPSVGEAGLAEELDEAQARQRCGQRWLDDHRAAGRHGRDHLVHNQVERVVERWSGPSRGKVHTRARVTRVPDLR